jgi:hypothetical protein
MHVSGEGRFSAREYLPKGYSGWLRALAAEMAFLSRGVIYTQSVFSMHWYRMRELWVTLASSAEFHEGSRTWQDGRIRKLFRIRPPIIQAGSNGKADHRQSRSGGVPQRVNLSVPETARENFLKWVVERHSRDHTVHSPQRVHRMRNLRGYFLCLLPAWSSSPFGAASVATLVPARKAYQQPFEPPKVVLMPTMALSMAVPP